MRPPGRARFFTSNQQAAAGRVAAPGHGSDAGRGTGQGAAARATGSTVRAVMMNSGASK
jgi:hypothetical protein